MDQDKLNSIHQETKSPPAKIKLQKKDKFRTEKLSRKAAVKQTYFRKRATQISEYLQINCQAMRTRKHQFHNK